MLTARVLPYCVVVNFFDVSKPFEKYRRKNSSSLSYMALWRQMNCSCVVTGILYCDELCSFRQQLHKCIEADDYSQMVNGLYCRLQLDKFMQKRFHHILVSGCLQTELRKSQLDSVLLVYQTRAVLCQLSQTGLDRRQCL